MNAVKHRTLHDIATPSLVLDKHVLWRNCETMSAKMKKAGLQFRPHMKTAKSADVARMATMGHFGGITVSTLKEAEYFYANGFTDITYAVGIAPQKLEWVASLQGRGATMNIITDNPVSAAAIADYAAANDERFRVFIEIDPGYHRAGLDPADVRLLEVADILSVSDRLELRGVLAHGGQSYNAGGPAGVKDCARQERDSLVSASERLRDAGHPCPVVSAGSTPTAMLGEDFSGLTEMRPGNYMFFDLFQAGLGVCRLDDIAVFVVATVIGHKPDGGHLLIDAGSLALSKDLSANKTMPGAGHGLVCDLETGQPIPGLCVRDTSQEHGWVAMFESAQPVPWGRLPIGTRVRVLPNHSCITAAMHDGYFVIDGGTEVVSAWPRVNGW